MLLRNLILIFCCFIICINILFAQSSKEFKIDSLKKELVKNLDDTTRVKTLHKFLKLTIYDKSDSTERKLIENIEFSSKINFKKGHASACKLYALYLNHYGNYTKALVYLYKTLKIADEINDKKLIADCYISISGCHGERGEYEQQLKFLNKCLKIRQEMSDKRGIAGAYQNIMVAYNNKKDFIKEEIYGLKAIDLLKEIKDTHALSSPYCNLGMLYSRRKDFAKADHYLNEAKKIAERYKDEYELTYVYKALGIQYESEKKYDLAIYNYNKSLAICTKLNLTPEASDIYMSLSEVSEATNKYKDAYYFLKQFQIMTDSMFASDSNERLAEMAEKYKSEQNQKEIELQNLEIKDQNRTKLFLIGGIIFVIGFLIFAIRAYMQKNKSNNLLQKQKTLIEEKNEKLEYAYHEISHQKEEITAQRDEIELKGNLLQEKNNEITDSINYALKIQQAALPNKKVLDEFLFSNFILYNPKDIVSGDFYYFSVNQDNNNEILIAVGDCTGHGVPGAFMSLIGLEKLKEASVACNNDPAKTLSYLNKAIKNSLHQNEKNNSRDGMDIALILINKINKTIDFASANRPLYLISEKENKLNEYKATKAAIGGFTDDEQIFESIKINYGNGDSLYLTTDGYADQFGGAANKKMMTKQFKDILTTNSNKNIHEVKTILSNHFDNWKGTNEQVDDVLVIGMKLI